MRALLLLLTASAALAGDKSAEELIRMLGSDLQEDRVWATNRLRDMGEDVLPALKKLAPEDPELARRVRSLVRSSLSLRVTISAPERHPLGTTLYLKARLVNDTYDTYNIPAARPPRRGNGTLSTFFYKVGDDPNPRWLNPDQVEFSAEVGNPIVLHPGRHISVVITLDKDQCPIRAPGTYTFRAGFYCKQVPKLPGGGIPRAEDDFEMVPAIHISKPITVTAKGTKPAQLEAALRSGDAKRRELAIAEISVRQDADVLAILRRHAEDEDLRLPAIRRLGAAADEQDVDLIRNATKDPNRLVRREATTALGNFRHRKARSKLIALTYNFELKTYAVKALTRHKHPVTIDCFVRLLKGNYHEGPWVRPVLDALYDWTSLPVQNRRRSIDAFERWWRKNRDAWTKKNLTRSR